MDHPTTVAIVKLGVSTGVAIALLLVGIFGGDLWYRPIAVAAFIVVAAPVVLLVSIDTGRVIRRQKSLGHAAIIATRIPQYLFGLLAIIAGIAGVVLALLHITDPQVWSYGLFLFSAGLIFFGVRMLLRPDSIGTKKS
jgi:hypothetical membrane protein